MIFKNSPLEVNIDFRSDFDANLCPCWPPKSKIFQNSGIPRQLKIFIDFGIDFLSILGPSWPPTWGHLGSQDASKSEKWLKKIDVWAPQEGVWIRSFLEHRLGIDFGGSRVDFWRVRARFSKILNDFFLVLLPTLGMFSGVRVMFSVVTLNPSSWLRFRRSWQILQPIWQEKLRTCRGQRREKNFTTIFMHPRIFSYSCQLVFWREHHWLGSFSCSGPRPRARSRE